MFQWATPLNMNITVDHTPLYYFTFLYASFYHLSIFIIPSCNTFSCSSLVVNASTEASCRHAGTRDKDGEEDPSSQQHI